MEVNDGQSIEHAELVTDGWPRGERLDTIGMLVSEKVARRSGHSDRRPRDALMLSVCEHSWDVEAGARCGLQRLDSRACRCRGVMIR